MTGLNHSGCPQTQSNFRSIQSVYWERSSATCLAVVIINVFFLSSLGEPGGGYPLLRSKCARSAYMCVCGGGGGGRRAGGCKCLCVCVGVRACVCVCARVRASHLLSATVRVYSLVAPCHLPDLTSLALLGVSSRPARAF